MLEKLKDIISKYPQNSVSLIIKSKYPEIYAWVNSQCDQLFSTFKEKIQWIISDKPSLYCSNNKRKKFTPKRNNWGFCGSPAVCECHKDSIRSRVKNSTVFGTTSFIKKRTDTWKDRYGVDNPQKLADYKKSASERQSSRRHTESRIQEYRETGYNDVVLRLESSGFEPLFDLDDYRGSRRQYVYRWLCKGCNSTVSSHIDYGTIPRCSICNPKEVSLQEHQLREFLDSLDVPYETNTRDIIPPLELDIYIPSHNVAIELNGMYWHSDIMKDKRYHVNKFNQCRDRGIHLIQIFESEWKNKRAIVEARLRNVLNLSNRVYARKCTVLEISGSQSAHFINQHHLQGNVSSKINLSLTYNGSMVAVMTFGKSRYNNSQDYELLRYCSDGTVVGGAGKLFSYFVKHYSPDTVLSYADRCWSNGNMYKALGFKDLTVDIHNVGYFYHKNGKDYHRSSLTKKRLVGMGHDSSLTADEILKQEGYLKIFDCGNYKFVYTK